MQSGFGKTGLSRAQNIGPRLHRCICVMQRWRHHSPDYVFL